MIPLAAHRAAYRICPGTRPGKYIENAVARRHGIYIERGGVEIRRPVSRARGEITARTAFYFERFPSVQRTVYLPVLLFQLYSLLIEFQSDFVPLKVIVFSLVQEKNALEPMVLTLA